MIFFTTLKENRLVSPSKEAGYIHLDQIEWTPEQLQNGLLVRLKEVPFKVRLFKLVAPNGDIDWGITNGSDETLTAQIAQDANDVRWQVEELHRGLKQLTGTEKCQARKARSQRNHLACCYHAWLSLKVKAKQLNKTLYRVKSQQDSLIPFNLSSIVLEVSQGTSPFYGEAILSVRISSVLAEAGQLIIMIVGNRTDLP